MYVEFGTAKMMTKNIIIIVFIDRLVFVIIMPPPLDII